MSHVNIFSKTSDTKTIIRFIREIEKYPCLYDPKSPYYIDRELKRKTWISIAKKANSTVADCKEKWTKIRTAYIRTLRPSYNDGIRTFGRPYYLASHLKFISPMKRHGAKNCDYRPSTSEKKPQSKEYHEIEINEEEEQSDDSEDDSSSQDENSQHEVFLDEDANDLDNDEDIMGYDNIVTDKKDRTRQTEIKEDNKTKVKQFKNKNYQNSEAAKIEKRKLCNENIESNPRKMFIFSLLPDIEDLDEEQMRYFRREVIKLIDKVMLN